MLCNAGTGRAACVSPRDREVGLRKLALAAAIGLLCLALNVTASCPELLGRWPYGPATSVAVSGSVAFFGSGAALVPVNLDAMYAAPAVGLQLPSVVRRIALAGNVALVATGEGGLRIVDVSQPFSPVEVGHLDGMAASVAVAGGFAYVTGGASGSGPSLSVVDISVPPHPTPVGSWSVEGESGAVAVLGSHAYVGVSTPGSGAAVWVVSLADPAHPVAATVFGAYPAGSTVTDIAVSGALGLVAVAGSGGRVSVVDLTDPAAPVATGEISIADPRSLAIANGHAYVGTRGSGLHVFSLANPAAPSEVGSLASPPSVLGIALSGSVAVLAANGDGLLKVDISDPAHPVAVSSQDTPGVALDAAATDRLVLFAEGGSVRLMDAWMLGMNFRYSAETPAPGFAYAVAVARYTGYVANAGSGVSVVSLAGFCMFPRCAPPFTWLGSVAVPGLSGMLATAGKLVFTSTSTHTLCVIDVADPQQPRLRGCADPAATEDRQAVAASGSYGLVANAGGLSIYDAADPDHPVRVGQVTRDNLHGEGLHGVAVVANLAVALGDASLFVIDVSQPSAPVVAGELPGATGSDIGLAGKVAVVTRAGDGVRALVDLVDPAHPRLLGSMRLSGEGDPITVAAEGERAYVGDGRAGVWTFDTSGCLPCALSCSATVPQWTFAGDPTLFHAAVLAGACRESPAIDWDFGDGTPHSSTGDPSHTYATTAELGYHFWTLKVSADDETCTQNGVVYVNPPPPCSLDCEAVVPAYAQVDRPVLFQSEVTPSHCSGPVTYEWHFGDGSPGAADPSPSHPYAAKGTFGWRLVASADQQTCASSGSITIGAGFCQGPYGLFVPAVAHKPGLNRSQWRSDLNLLNLGASDAPVDLALLLTNRSNLDPAIATVSAPSGRGLRVVDVLGTLLPGASGALGIRSCAGPVLASSRFYDAGAIPDGTAGMYVAAVDDGRAVTGSLLGVFHGLAYSLDPGRGFRVNIGVVNATAFAADVVIRLRGDDGSVVGTKSLRLQPYEHRQYTKIHELLGTPPVANGTATVEVNTPGARVHPYAMLIDNASGDPIYMPVELVRR